MWIVFGWEKEQKEVGIVGKIFCYDCRRRSEWVLVKESEWVTFSAIRVFRFILKHRLHCCGCSAELPLTASSVKQLTRHLLTHESIDETQLHRALSQQVEARQLSGKTPLQLKYIRESMAAQQEYEAAMNEQRNKSKLQETEVEAN